MARPKGSKVVPCTQCGKRVVVRGEFPTAADIAPTPCKHCGTLHTHPNPVVVGNVAAE